MKQIRFDIETLTPTFMSGGDQGEFELRPPSFKGMMRFWWRAYFWGKNSGTITHQDIEKEEGKIFGTASAKRQQKSGFSIQITKADKQAVKSPFPKYNVQASSGGRTFPINVLEYLAYGTFEYQKGKNVFIREYLPVNSSSSVTLNISDESVEEDVIISFYLLAVCGGIGAKSRNGFGNFFIRKIAIENPEILGNLNLSFPFPKTDFLEKVVKNNNLPSFTAFSKKMKFFKLKQSCKTWDECLGRLGEIYRTGKLNLDEPHTCEKRQYIASPITSQKYVGGRNRIYDQSFLERHAKPYFLKVVQTKGGFDGYILYLPSRYCEGLEKDRNNNCIPTDADEKFKKYCDEFNGYLAKEMEICYP